MRCHNKIQLLSMLNTHLVAYPTPMNLNYSWNGGSLAGMMLASQMLTGILLAMHYVGHVDHAFASVQHLMTDVPSGIILRYAHANGASLFFIVVYLHILRGMYYGSGAQPREMVWISGVLILLLMIITAFIGYVLPWGQMSFWGATVITNLASAIPVVGDAIKYWLWGGFSIDQPTLNRFYSLHYTLPFVLAGLSIFHIAALHQYGSTNPLGVNSQSSTLAFGTYFGAKDLLGALYLALLFSVLVFFYPDLLGHPDNLIPANSLVTPHHIVPEWYFLWVYAILRSIPSKAMGVLAIGLVFISLFALPFIGLGGGKFRIITEWLYWTFLADVFLLTWLGGLEITKTTTFVGQLCTVYLFVYLLLLLPMIGYLECNFTAASSLQTVRGVYADTPAVVFNSNHGRVQAAMNANRFYCSQPDRPVEGGLGTRALSLAADLRKFVWLQWWSFTEARLSSVFGAIFMCFYVLALYISQAVLRFHFGVFHFLPLFVSAVLYLQLLQVYFILRARYSLFGLIFELPFIIAVNLLELLFRSFAVVVVFVYTIVVGLLQMLAASARNFGSFGHRDGSRRYSSLGPKAKPMSELLRLAMLKSRYIWYTRWAGAAHALNLFLHGTEGVKTIKPPVFPDPRPFKLDKRWDLLLIKPDSRVHRVVNFLWPPASSKVANVARAFGYGWAGYTVFQLVVLGALQASGIELSAVLQHLDQFGSLCSGFGLDKYGSLCSDFGLFCHEFGIYLNHALTHKHPSTVQAIIDAVGTSAFLYAMMDNFMLEFLGAEAVFNQINQTVGSGHSNSAANSVGSGSNEAVTADSVGSGSNEAVTADSTESMEDYSGPSTSGDDRRVLPHDRATTTPYFDPKEIVRDWNAQSRKLMFEFLRDEMDRANNAAGGIPLPGAVPLEAQAEVPLEVPQEVKAELPGVVPPEAQVQPPVIRKPSDAVVPVNISNSQPQSNLSFDLNLPPEQAWQESQKYNDNK